MATTALVLPTVGVTSFYAVILSAIFVKLTLDVINLRHEEKIVIGTAGGSENLHRAVGAQINFSITSLWVLILLFLADFADVFAFFLHLIMIAFVASRLLHAYSLKVYEQKTGSYGLRRLSMLGTFFTIFALGIINLYLSLFG